MSSHEWNTAFERATDQYGYITRSDMISLKLDPTLLRMWRMRGKILRAGHGIYRFQQIPVTDLDPYMLATLWPGGKGIISHHSALLLHELCDINPEVIHMTVPSGYRVRRRGGRMYELHHQDLDSTQLGWFEGIRIVSPLTAIEQGMKAGVPSHLLQEATENGGELGLISPQDLHRLQQTQISA